MSEVNKEESINLQNPKTLAVEVSTDTTNLHTMDSKHSDTGIVHKKHRDFNVTPISSNNGVSDFIVNSI